MDPVFKALADPARRHLLDRLFAQDGQTLGDLCRDQAMTRQAVMKHLAILESANLISTKRRGREKLHYLNPVPINDIADRWVRKFEHRRLAALADMKRRLEAPMTSRTFRYVLYIATTPDKLWEALTSNEMWQQYWGEWQVESDWKAGSPLVFRSGDGSFFSQGEIVVSDPPRRLSYTWPNPPEEQGDAPPERLTWEISDNGAGGVKLTFTHENLTEEFLAGVSEGWPAVLSSLKSLLETGTAPPFDSRG